MCLGRDAFGKLGAHNQLSHNTGLNCGVLKTEVPTEEKLVDFLPALLS